jgi:hypothetical protein
MLQAFSSEQNRNCMHASSTRSAVAKLAGNPRYREE